MGVFDSIIERAKQNVSYRGRFFFTKRIESKIYDNIVKALEPFSHISKQILGKELDFVVIPVKEDPRRIISSKPILQFLKDKTGSFTRPYEMMHRVVNGYAAYYNGVILILDDTSISTIQHEIFHFIRDKLLNEKTKQHIEKLFKDAHEIKGFVHKEQKKNLKEYFAYSGQYYLNHGYFFGAFLNNHKKLGNKDPMMYHLIEDILADKSDLFV